MTNGYGFYSATLYWTRGKQAAYQWSTDRPRNVARL